MAARNNEVVEQLADMVVSLGCISRSELEVAAARLADGKPGDLWRLLGREGYLSQPQCDTLVMAEKRYISLEAARVTVELHSAAKSNDRPAETPGSATNLRIRRPPPPLVDDSDDEAEPPPELRRSSFTVQRLSGAESLLSREPTPLPAPPPKGPARGDATEEDPFPRARRLAEQIKAAPLPSPGSPRDLRQLAGATLGKYRLEQRLGRGASGSVFKAHHATLDIPVALKILDPNLADFHPELVDRFLREARTAVRINHPNVVRILDCDRIDGYHVIAMEYVEGETVADLLAREGPMAEERALATALAVARGLEAALESGIIHRDVKPANIMLTATRQTKLADLGLGKHLSQTERSLSDTSPNIPLGTPHFFSPEQARDAASVDARADIYSLGATLFNMLTARFPFTGKNVYDLIKAHESEPVAPPHAVNPRVTATTSGLVVRMMAKSPAARPADYGEVINALQECLFRLSNGGIGATKPGAMTANLASMLGSLFKR
ncbi:MAG: serine/threonine-protein kinase [Candidatus Sumerlaeia bacterium]|nr:serine/threonine-protein kinase [Candidatus Sumerlaeia bacterium]